jgi:hypothetical protein
MATRRERILGEFVARLQTIRTENGYATDAGALILLGDVVALGPDDPPAAIAIVPQDDRPRFQGMQHFLEWPIEVQAIVTPDLDKAWLSVEAIVGDIKRAVETDDRTLAGLVPRTIERGTTRVLPRDPGVSVVGAGVTYLVPYAESWGNP